MSRCFPFPPPGYEKKPKPEEDLFQEEKRKEKKHKKEKKSKRKREDDDKEERNKGRDKQKEKKEKKDKHRDKKEEKSKGKGKDKSSPSEDATTAVEPEISKREECSTFKSRGFTENKGASAFQGQNGRNVTDNMLVRESEKSKLEGKPIGGQTIQRSSNSDQRGYQENEESKFVQELGRRIKDEGKAIESRTIQRSSTSALNCLHNSAKDMECGVAPPKMEGKGLKVGLQFNGNNTLQNLTGSVDLPREPVHKVIERTVDKSKEKSDSKRGEKRKDRDKKEKKSHGKDKGRDKIRKKEKDDEKKKEETEKERIEFKNRSKELFKNGHSTSSKNINVHSSQVDNKIVSTEANVNKTMDVEANGFGHEKEIQSNKVRTDQVMNNGKTLEGCQSLDPLQDTVKTKYHELNGVVELPNMPKQKSPLEPRRSDQPIEALEKSLLSDKVVEPSRKLPRAPLVVEPSKRASDASRIVEKSLLSDKVVEPVKKPPRADRESSRKPPHPDLKYLSEILSVPKMEEWPEVDDQEWLFSNKNLPLEKQKPDVVSVDSRQPHVWSEALHLESADLYALPYVIPY